MKPSGADLLAGRRRVRFWVEVVAATLGGVVPAALDTLVRLRPASTAETLLAKLKDEDPAVRAAAARGIGELKTAGGAGALVAADRAAGRGPS